MTRRLRRPMIVGWMMLLVVLISAVPTTGQARTRVIGSAFDPATYSVVVSPKKPRVTGAKASLARKAPLDDLFNGAPVPVVVERAPVAPVFDLATEVRYQGFPEHPNSRSLFVRAHGPRAPPAI